ncbi:MAG: hypothetical protein V4543_11940 [Bacteroidota bacterium]
MSQNLVPYLKLLAAFIATSVVIAVLRVLGLGNWVFADINIINIAMFCIALFAHRIVAMGQGNINISSGVYLLGTTMRMLFSLGALGAYLYMHPESQTAPGLLVTDFFLLYIIYAAFEIQSFRANLRRGSKNQSKI